jgi:hypothetical protein
MTNEKIDKKTVEFDEVLLFHNATFTKEPNAIAKLIINKDNIKIRITEKLIEREDLLGVPIEIPLKDISLACKDIRSLNFINIDDNYEFSAEFGSGKKYVKYGLRIQNPINEDFIYFKTLLMELPDFVKLPPCLKCGGPVKENICQVCGAKGTSQARKSGLKLILVGIGLIAFLGIFIYPINLFITKAFCAFGGFIGLLLLAFGAYSIISGKK